MSNKNKGKILRYTALGIDVGAPLAATISQFPIWVEESSEATFSGLFLLFAILSILPFINRVKEYLKSPSVPVLWTILFVIFLMLQNIIKEMTAVCLVGMVANILGAGVHKLGTVIESKEDE